MRTVSTAQQVYDPKLTKLTATVAGWQTPATTRTVTLMMDGKTLQSKDVAIPPNGAAQVEFTGFDVPYGRHRGGVRITPNDQLAQDDTFPFSVQRSDPGRVLFLYAGNRAQQAFYYRSAMESTAESGLIVQPLSMEQAGNMDFSKYAYVVLNDPGSLDEKLANALCAYVSHGGALLLSVGPETMRHGKVPLSGDRINGGQPIQGAGFVDEHHPSVVGTGKFENVQFSEAASIIPKRDARVVAKLANGSPLLIEERMGEGRELIFASTLDNSTNDFPLHSSFRGIRSSIGALLGRPGGRERERYGRNACNAASKRKARVQRQM